MSHFTTLEGAKIIENHAVGLVKYTKNKAVVDTQLAKAKTRKVSPLGKLLATYNELLGAWIVSGLTGYLKILQTDPHGSYAIEYCGYEPTNFKSVTIYQGDYKFELKKQRILDYLSGKIDYLEEQGEFL